MHSLQTKILALALRQRYCEIQKHNVSLSEKLLWEAIVIKAFGLPKHSILLLYYSREGKLHNPQIMAQTMISMGSMHGNTRVQE